MTNFNNCARRSVSVFLAVLFLAMAFGGAAQAQATQSGGSAESVDSPCARFPAESVFDDLEKALLTPEKVKCLNPTFDGSELNMKRLPSRLGTLVNLEVFSFGCLESLETLPEEIGNLSKLEELIIDNGNGCTMSVSIPRSIGKLKNLRILRLYGAIESPARGRTKSLPDTIANLRSLEVLDLGRNGLAAAPPQIAALTNLKILRLEYNNLRTVPAFVGNFKNLRELSLDANEHIFNLPAPMAKLKGLNVSMGNNALKLKEQKSLRTRFPGIVFSFENEYDDGRANEEARRPNVLTVQGDTNLNATDAVDLTYKGAVSKGTTEASGVLNSSAMSLPQPVYPPAAKAVRSSGTVQVRVTIDESGNVISVAAISGPALLRAAAESAARKATFAPTLLQGVPVKVTGIIIYNFIL